MLTHDQFRELAATALDFELEDGEREALEGHVAGCVPCRQFDEGLRRDLSWLEALPATDAPSRVARAVGRAVARSASGRSGWTRAATALAVVAVITGPIALGLVALRDFDLGLGFAGGGPGPATTPTLAAWRAVVGGPAATGAPEPQATGAPASQAPDGSLDAVDTLESVAFRAVSGFVAVGSACPHGAAVKDCSAAVVISSDGTTWTPAPGPALTVAPIGRGIQAGFRDLVAGGPGFVGGGAAGNADGLTAVVWTSPDGRAWARTPELRGAASAWINAIALRGDGRLIAVGGSFLPSGEQPTGRDSAVRGAIWTSSDGLRWERLADTPALDVGVRGEVRFGRPEAGIWDVVWTGSGLVAVGSACDAKAGCRGVAWTSADGADWARVTDAFGAGQPMALARLGERSVAVGRSGPAAAAWTSDDGQRWTMSTPDGASGSELRALIGGNGRFLAGGTGGIWSSSDGTNWHRDGPLDAFTGATVVGLAQSGDRLVAVGLVGEQHEAAIWVRRPVDGLDQ